MQFIWWWYSFYGIVSSIYKGSIIVEDIKVDDKRQAVSTLKVNIKFPLVVGFPIWYMICTSKMGEGCSDIAHQSYIKLLAQIELKKDLDVPVITGELESIPYLTCTIIQEIQQFEEDDILVDRFTEWNQDFILLFTYKYNVPPFSLTNFAFHFERNVKYSNKYNIEGYWKITPMYLQLEYECPSDMIKKLNCIIRCIETRRNYCSVSGENCKRGWLPAEVNYIYKTTTCNAPEIVYHSMRAEKCTFADSCVSELSSKCKDKMCITIENNTFICVILSYKIQSNQQDPLFNVTYTVMDKNEEFFFYLYYKDLPDILLNQCKFLITSYQVSDSIASYAFHLYNNRLKLFYKNIQTGIVVNVLGSLIINDISLYWPINLSFTVIDLPKNIYLSKGQSIIIYWGETVCCEADGSERDSYLFQWDTPGADFNLDTQLSEYNCIFIFENYNTKQVLLRCTVHYSVPNRPLYKISKMFPKYILAYKEFEWRNPYKNIYEINNTIFCHINGSMKAFYTQIKQIRGTENIDFESKSNSVLLNPKTFLPTVYVFNCQLVLDGFVLDIDKFKELEIYFSPSKVCLAPFPKVIGALILCKSDGNPLDHYTIIMSIYEIHPFLSILLATRLGTSVRIPYVVRSKYLKVFCHVKHQNDSLIQADELEFNLIEETLLTEVYDVKGCEALLDFPEEVEVYRYRDHFVQKVPLFHLFNRPVDKQPSYLYLASTIVFYWSLVPLTFVLIHLLRTRLKAGKHNSSYYIYRKQYKLRMRHLQDYLKYRVQATLLAFDINSLTLRSMSNLDNESLLGFSQNEDLLSLCSGDSLIKPIKVCGMFQYTTPNKVPFNVLTLKKLKFYQLRDMLLDIEIESRKLHKYERRKIS